MNDTRGLSSSPFRGIQAPFGGLTNKCVFAIFQSIAICLDTVYRITPASRVAVLGIKGYIIYNFCSIFLEFTTTIFSSYRLKRERVTLLVMKNPLNKDAAVKSVKLKKTSTSSRRNLLKGLVIGGVAVTSGIIVGKMVFKRLPEPGLRQRYISDVAPGDRVHQSREHVVMTTREKSDMVKFFKANHRRNS